MTKSFEKYFRKISATQQASKKLRERERERELEIPKKNPTMARKQWIRHQEVPQRQSV
jgi:hypothetical protein